MKFPGVRYIYSVLLLAFLIIQVKGQSLILPDDFLEYEISVSNSPDEAYLFLSSRPVKTKFPGYAMILDNYGTPVYYRYLSGRGGGLIIQRNGMLSFKHDLGGQMKYYIMDSSFVIVDSVGMNDYTIDSHDFLVLKNGHFLMFGKDIRITDLSAYGGPVDATVTGCIIRELDQDKSIVFEWNTWDHFSITDTYSDLTASSVDMVHPNSLDVDENGNIFLISRTMNEVTKINRQTGDIIWRLGGKNNQFSFGDSSQMFSKPHDFRLLENGNYTIFDNGNERDPSYSRAIEYAIDETNKTIELVWEYDADKKVFGPSGGSTRRLPSGNTITCYGGKASQPSIIEVHPEGSKSLQLDFSDGISAAKVYKFPWRTTLFEPNTYSVNFGEWDGYTAGLYLLTIKNNAEYPVTLTGWSTRSNAFGVKTKFPVELGVGDIDTLWLEYFPIGINTGHLEDVLTINSDINSDTLVQRIAQQVKLYGTKMDKLPPTARISLDSSVNVPVDTVVYITMSEAVRKAGGVELDYSNVDSLIVLRRDGTEGKNIPFDAVISTDKTLITITPDSSLADSQVYYVAISDEFEDYSGNRGSGVSSVFFTYEPGPSTGLGLAGSGFNDSGLTKVFPNPGDGMFVLKFHNQAGRNISVYDLRGYKVYSAKNIKSDTHILDLKNQPASIYIVRTEDVLHGSVTTLRLVKNQ